MRACLPTALVLAVWICCPVHLKAAPLPAASAKEAPSPTPSAPVLKPTATLSRPSSSESSKALIVHKPMPSPHWGKLIQYRKEQAFSFSEKDRETLHEFVFQDESGVIRTAIYHEGLKGEGFWEVLVWDQ